MKLSALTEGELFESLCTEGLKLKIGPFNVSLATSVSNVADHLRGLYGSFELVDDNEFIDYHVSIKPPSNWRRFVASQVNFSFDGYYPFSPLPLRQAGAMFEWGLNWCIANYSHQYLIIHAAVVERNGFALLLPGTPGSGKSTLCAALVCNGWRLLSDEIALLSLANGELYPIPRPISLKNKSIDIIQDFSNKAVIGRTVQDTAKGTVGHMRPLDECVSQAVISVKPSKLVFPRYQKGSETSLQPIAKCRAFMKAAENSFNYNVLGAIGFRALAELIDMCDSYEFKYQSLDEALSCFNQLSN